MRDHPTLNGFDAPSYDTWRKLVEHDLAGTSFEKRLVKRVAGIDIRPLYVRADERPDSVGLPGFPPYIRARSALGASETGWDVRQETACADPALASRWVLDDLTGGATSIALTLDRRMRRGTPPPHDANSLDELEQLQPESEGLTLSSLADLEAVLARVPLDEVPLMLFAGVCALPLAAGIVALAAKRNIPTHSLSGALGADPLGTLAAEGALPVSLDLALAEAAALAVWTAERAPALRAVTVDTSAYHDAAADAPMELAVALATGVAYLRTLTAAGLGLDDAAGQLVFSFSVGRDFFVEIAKLRAARGLWTRVMSVCGVEPDSTGQKMVIHARTSRRTKSQRDHWVNILRSTAETFSAAVGGADSITTVSFDAPLGESDPSGRRIARNIQHVLRYEANAHRVVDPTGGSWYVEAVTDALARKAWERFQAIERAGGIARVLSSGALQAELRGMLDAERRAVETRRTSIIGVNEFPNVGEESASRRGRPRQEPSGFITPRRAESIPVCTERFGSGSLVEDAIRAASEGASFLGIRAALDRRGGPEAARVTRLVQERMAHPFECLRDRADRYLAAHGKRPTAFLANLGAISEHKSRASFARNVFESGGFSVLGNDGYDSAESAAAAFAESGAEIAVLSSSDAVYAEQAGPAARALQAKNAKAIVLAGSPGAAEASYREAGVTDFVFDGVNVVAALDSLLDRVGAPR